MSTPKVIITIIISISYYTALGCSCIGPTNFMKNITDEHVIVYGKTGKTIHLNENEQIMGYSSVTIIHVNEYLSIPLKSDTLYYLNGSSAACQSAMNYYEPGTELIIKSGDFEDFDFYYKLLVENHQNKNIFDNIKNNQIISYTNCDIGDLIVKNNICSGNITHNKQYRSFKFIRTIKKISKRLSEYLWKINPNQYQLQKMPYEKLKKKIRRKLGIKMN